MTIPASSVVQIFPSVLSAGGVGLTLSGLFLTNGTRTPIGSVLSFPTANAVSTYYGAGSPEYANAVIYFNGFANSSIKPSAMLFAQYNQNPVYAYLRGGSTSGLTLPQLQALSGTLVLSVDGTTRTSSSITLSSATSFSNAASIIAAGFSGANLYDAITGAGTTIAAGTTTSVTGSITGYTLNVTAVGSGALVVGGVLSGTGITTGTYVKQQVTGTSGGIGTYLVSAQQTVTSTTITQSYGLMTVATIASGTLAVGQTISGAGVTVGTIITALGTGTGGAGTYVTSGGSQTVSATTVSSGPLVVTYDSVAQAFVITGGTPGSSGSIGFASGGLSAGISLTNATGAILSQATISASPSAFMNSIIDQTTNFATFTAIFDPDNGYGNAQKQLFSAWVNGTNDEFAYIVSDTDINPTLSSSATNSLGYILQQNQSSGTTVIYDPNGNLYNAFVCGAAASINYNETAGRITFAFKTQSGLPTSVNSQTVWANLIANGYSSYGAYATAAQGFNFLYPGNVSGPFKWLDSYVNQIWLNSNFQLDLMTMLTQLKSTPYAAVGYGQIRAALTSTIQQALINGVIQSGVPLSSLQISEVNTSAGLPIDKSLSSIGYYLQILPAQAIVRGNRQSPPINFWYCDGGSIQQIQMASIELQ